MKDREIREIVTARREYLRREAEKGLPILSCEPMPSNWLNGSDVDSKSWFINPFGSSRSTSGTMSVMSVKTFRLGNCYERSVLLSTAHYTTTARPLHGYYATTLFRVYYTLQ